MGKVDYSAFPSTTSTTTTTTSSTSNTNSSGSSGGGTCSSSGSNNNNKKGGHHYHTTNSGGLASPVKVSCDTWSAFIPNDSANSGLPTIFFDFTLDNSSSDSVDQECSLVMCQQNFVGWDGMSSIADASVSPTPAGR